MVLIIVQILWALVVFALVWSLSKSFREGFARGVRCAGGDEEACRQIVENYRRLRELQEADPWRVHKAVAALLATFLVFILLLILLR